MHDAGAHFAADAAASVSQIGNMAQQRVDQRAAVMSRRRMHHQARRLIDHDHVVVFIHDREGNRFGDKLRRRGRRHAHDDHIARPDLVTGLADRSIERDEAVVDEALHGGARQISQAGRHKPIEAAAFPGFNGQDVSLIGRHGE